MLEFLGPLIGFGASLLGGNEAAEGSKEGAERHELGYQRGKNLLMPYTAGTRAAHTMQGNALGINGGQAQQAFYNNFQADPGFQTALDNSLDETMKRYSIMGRTGGGMANALLKTGQGARLGAYRDRISQLGGYAEGGRNTSATIANLGQQSAAGQANSLAQAGQYQGAGIMNAGNALIGGVDNYMKMNQNAQGMASGQNPAARPWDTFTVNNRAMF